MLSKKMEIFATQIGAILEIISILLFLGTILWGISLLFPSIELNWFQSVGICFIIYIAKLIFTCL